MKIEIEISETEIQEIIKAHLTEMVKAAVRARSTNWGVESEVKQTVNKLWPETVEHQVREAMTDVPRLRDKIATVLERKLTAQLTKVTREAGL
jgi:hypothetical protein